MNTFLNFVERSLAGSTFGASSTRLIGAGTPKAIYGYF
jgi:hypothetical protein